jgi:hemerythrin
MLDEHHRILFRLLAEIAQGLESGGGEDWARGIGAQLLSYMDYHFHAEEALLSMAGYPFLPLHHASHQAIALRMRALLAPLGQHPPAEVMAGVRDFLGDWLSHHIEIEDFEYRPYLADES